jgi:hypothetical protein
MSVSLQGAVGWWIILFIGGAAYGYVSADRPKCPTSIDFGKSSHGPHHWPEHNLDVEVPARDHVPTPELPRVAGEPLHLAPELPKVPHGHVSVPIVLFVVPPIAGYVIGEKVRHSMYDDGECSYG